MFSNRFRDQNIDQATLAKLKELANLARGDILKMTTLAASGHPGGSMSSIEMYLTLYHFANIDPQNPKAPDRDKVVVSHGHTSPGCYSALGRLGFLDTDEMIAHFRQAGSPYEGHVERHLPGVEWSTGNLGQGLSAGAGFALSARLHGHDSSVFVVMGDGEQQKGQISEARRFAVKLGLNHLVAYVDFNRLQISGDTNQVMPQRIADNYRSDGWEVIEIDGHDFEEIYEATRTAMSTNDRPTCIMAHTTMGKGVSLMENDETYHGVALKPDQLEIALRELGLENDLEKYRARRGKVYEGEAGKPEFVPFKPIEAGTPHTYQKDDKSDNRSAFGRVMTDLAKNCRKHPDAIAVFDCDLAGSVKTAGFGVKAPDNFFQTGIQEHNTAVIAGAVSTTGIITFWADFGVFGIDETYNQQRLNDINEANLKVVCTHVGIDVGEDGKTHQCIDYIGLFNNLFGFKTVIPADPNQTDRIIRWVAPQPGNFLIPMGRSKIPVILDEDGNPFFGNYRFLYGKADIIRQGSEACIISTGTMTHKAVAAGDLLKEKGVSVMVVNLSCPSDPDMEVIEQAARTGLIITYEDHNARTGIGSIIAENLAARGICCRVERMGITQYCSSGSSKDLYAYYKIDVDDLVEKIQNLKK